MQIVPEKLEIDSRFNFKLFWHYFHACTRDVFIWYRSRFRSLVDTRTLLDVEVCVVRVATREWSNVFFEACNRLVRD